MVSRRPSEYLGVAQFGSVLEWGSRGRKFKSSHPDHNIPQDTASCGIFLYENLYASSLKNRLFPGLWGQNGGRIFPLIIKASRQDHGKPRNINVLGFCRFGGNFHVESALAVGFIGCLERSAFFSSLPDGSFCAAEKMGCPVRTALSTLLPVTAFMSLRSCNGRNGAQGGLLSPALGRSRMICCALQILFM